MDRISSENRHSAVFNTPESYVKKIFQALGFKLWALGSKEFISNYLCDAGINGNTGSYGF